MKGLVSRYSDLSRFSPLQADDLAAHQYAETLRRKTPLLPETSLLVALLEDALVTFKEKLCAQNDRGKKQFREAEDWIWNSNDGESCFSFNYVCEQLNISPAYLKERLTNWKRRALAAAPEAFAQPAGNERPVSNRRHHSGPHRQRVRHLRQDTAHKRKA